MAVKADDGGDPGATIAEYRFDGVNRRISKTLQSSGATTEYLFNAHWQVLEEDAFDAESAPVESHVYVWSPRYIDAPILRDTYDSDGVLDADGRVYYLGDATYNVTALVGNVNETWTVTDRYVYTAYGTAIAYDAAWSNPSAATTDGPLYAGYWLDGEAGNYLARNRFYSVAIASWFTRDPLVYKAGDSNLYRYVFNDPSEIEGGDFNLYRYVHNSPTSRLDPSGLSDLDKKTDPSQLREKEIVIFLGHNVPSKLTEENRAEAADIQDLDEIEHALKRMAANTKNPPKDAYVAAVGCFQPSAKEVVDELFPGSWLEGLRTVKKDRLTKAKEDVPIALQAYRLARQKKDYTLSVYADQEFKDAIQWRTNFLNRQNQQHFDQKRATEVNDLQQLYNAAGKPRGAR